MTAGAPPADDGRMGAWQGKLMARGSCPNSQAENRRLSEGGSVRSLDRWVDSFVHAGMFGTTLLLPLWVLLVISGLFLALLPLPATLCRKEPL